MKLFVSIISIALLNSLLCVSVVFGQSQEKDSLRSLLDKVDVSFSATIQPRVGYGLDQTDGEADVERFGFGLRRARFRVTADFSDLVGLFYDVEFATGDLSAVSLYAFYQPTSSLRMRAGYVDGAQPESYIPTSHTRVDLLERAAIAENWSRNTFGSRGRDFGVEAEYDFGGGDLALFVHTGDGNFDRSRGNFRQTVSSLTATRGTDRTEFALSSKLRFKDVGIKGIQLGGFASYNASRNPNTAVNDVGRSVLSWSAHAYYGARAGSQPFRLKLDVIGLNFEELTEESGTVFAAQNSLGFSVLGAVRIFPGTELLARFERLMPDNGGSDIDFMSAGFSFSPSALRGQQYRRERITLVYSNAMPDGSSAHLLELQGQLAF